MSGGIGLASWAMPDVVEGKNVHYRASYAYDVDRYYVLPFHQGLQPGGSYIDNLTIDTVYRLVVTYGYSGEDRTNHYAVKEQYPPHSYSRMRGRTVHVMDTIAPWMPASRGRIGRYRTQRVYLTDYMHLQDFISVDMRKFGLYGNERVDRIEESRNSLIRESQEKYRAYKSINPYPYIRLIPDSLRKRRLKGRAKKKSKKNISIVGISLKPILSAYEQKIICKGQLACLHDGPAPDGIMRYFQENGESYAVYSGD